MAFAPIDWIIVIIFFILLCSLAVYSKRYTVSVADFLSANRCAGRYLISVSSGLAAVAAITIIANWQKFYKSGFGGGFWTYIVQIVLILIPLTGWIIYRFRQTRALTMAQFLEIRYSRRFRIFAGIMAWVSGILNYGVFPSITARFFIYFCDIPQKYIQVGFLEINLTFALVMLFILTVGVIFTITGGQITVMITDFCQGQFTNIVMVVISIFLLVMFRWDQIYSALVAGAQENKSLVNPFEQTSIEGFSPSFFLMWAFMRFYTHKVWQGSQGYNSAAKSPHEAKMAGIIGAFRGQITKLMMMLVPICAFTLLHSNVYPEMAESAREAIQSISGQKWEREVATVVIAIREILPHGLLGVFGAMMLAAAISTDDTALHSWGSIFVQDVVLPFRKKHFGPKQHLRMLRWSCIGVAAFAWLFSMIFPLRDFIFMYFQITGCIFLGGAGAAVIGGLYWKRGTTAGAWAGMVYGVVFSIVGVLMRNVLWKPMLPWLQESWPTWQWLQVQDPLRFPLNGMEMTFGIAITSTLLYVLVSLFTKTKPGFSMDKMLHRGEHVVAGDYQVRSKRNNILARLGLNEEFSGFDKFIWYSQLGWALFWWLAMVILGVLWALGIWQVSWFKPFWFGQIWILLICVIFFTIWFFCGGLRDMFRLFKDLKQIRRNEYDDGMVYNEKES